MSDELDFNMISTAENGIPIHHLCGWAGKNDPDFVKDEYRKLSHKFRQFRISGATPISTGKRKMMLYEVVRKVLGKDTPNYAQEIGDCVSFGAKNCIEHLMCCEILLKGDAEDFKLIFPPYLYGTGRVFVGKGQIPGNEDGSTGAWMADAVQQYGVLAAEAPNCPKYSGSVAKKWGADPGPPREFVDIAKIHPVKSAAKINDWNQAVEAVCNGYPLTVASGKGFSMQPDSQGFHNEEGTWGHQTCVIGIDDEYNQPYVIILNSWGDVMGQLKDFETGEACPIGCFRVHKRTFEEMIGEGEVFAYSNFDGFPGQNREIDAKLFDLIA